MTWLLEERQAALLVVVVGIASVALLGIGWAKTGRKEILYVLGAVIAFCAILLALQRYVKTEAELVEATVATIARDVQRNDQQAVLEHVHSGAPQIRERAAEEFPRYKFEEVRITKFHEVSVDMRHVPPKAVVKFTVAVTGKDAEGLLEGRTIWRYVEVTFYKENGRWRVHHYEHDDPQRAIMK